MHIDMNMLVVFLGKCIPPPQKPWLWTEKSQKALAVLYLASNGCEMLRTQCADRVSSRTDHKDEVLQIKANFVTWTFRLPPKRQLSILLNIFFPFIDISYFSQIQNFRTVEQSFCCTGRPKDRAISRQEKMTFSSPGRVALGLPSSSPRVWAYANVRTKFQIPNLLRNGAPLARYVAGSAMKRDLSFCFQENHLNGIIWWKQLSNNSAALVQNNKI